MGVPTSHLLTGKVLKLERKDAVEMDSQRYHNPPAHRIIPTGNKALDQALGIGGIPCGRISEIVGPPGVGKTALSLQILAQAQIMGESVAYIDGTHTLDAAYAREHGLNPEKLIIKKPTSFKEALGIAEILVDEGQVGALVVDSLVLLPLQQSEGGVVDPIGERALHMASTVRKLSSLLMQRSTAVLFLVSTRRTRDLWVGSQAAPGGSALRFFAGIRLSLSPDGQPRAAADAVDQAIVARVLKNRLAPPPYPSANLNILL